MIWGNIDLMLWFIYGVPVNSIWFQCLYFDELIKKMLQLGLERVEALPWYKEIGTKVSYGGMEHNLC
jgi:hypothetical protein